MSVASLLRPLSAVVAIAIVAIAEARVELLPEPIGCRVSAMYLYPVPDQGMCQHLYRGVTASHVDTAFNAGRADPLVIDESGASTHFLYDSPQTFNTVCFQQPPSVQQWDVPFQPLIESLEIWAVPSDALQGDASAPLPEPDFVAAVSPDSALRCYALPREATSQRVIVRLGMSPQGTGPTAASTLVFAHETAWEPAPSSMTMPAIAGPRMTGLTESAPVQAAEVMAVHPATDCSPQTTWGNWNADFSCRMAIDVTPVAADVNTAFAAGAREAWVPPMSAQAQLTISMPMASFVNGLCVQGRTSTPNSFVDRTGRVDVWAGRISDVNAASAPPPDAIVELPRSSGGMELLCFRLASLEGPAVNFTTTDMTLRVWKAFGAASAHGLSTALAAIIRAPETAGDASPPTTFTFRKPVSCNTEVNFNGVSCAALYSAPISASDVGTPYAAGRKSPNNANLAQSGIVRFLYDTVTTMNTVCLQQPPTYGSWGISLLPIVSSLDVWTGNVPAMTSWTSPSAAPHTVQVSSDSTLLCYPLPAILSTRNVSVRLSLSATSQGVPSASTLVFAHDPAWSPPSPSSPAIAPNSGALADRGLHRETLPVAAGLLRTTHAVAGCDPNPRWPDGGFSCGGAYDRMPAPSDVNTPFTAGLDAEWVPTGDVAAPLTLTLASSSFINAVCFQQRNIVRPPSHTDMAGMLEVWSGRVSSSAMENTPPQATVFVPMAAGRELLCYQLRNAQTGADVNFTATDVSFRLWRAPGLFGVQGAGTLLPAIAGEPDAVFPTPAAAGPAAPAVAPGAAGPATDTGDTSGRGSSQGTTDDSNGQVSVVVLIGIIAAAAIIIAVVVAVAYVCANRSNRSNDEVNTTPAAAPPQQAAAGAGGGVSMMIPVEGKPVCDTDKSDPSVAQQHAYPYAPDHQFGYPPTTTNDTNAATAMPV